MKETKEEAINSTIGMMASHNNLRRYGFVESILVKVVYSRTIIDNIMLTAVSGHNLAVIKQIKQVIITKEEYNDRPFDYYDDTVEFFWAISMLGFNVPRENENDEW